MPTDPSVSVRLYSWSSEEFHQEHALIYTSRFNPSQTCISHWRSNRDMALFTLQDFVSVGNPVVIELKIKAERDHRGFRRFSSFEVTNHRGKFMQQKTEPGLCMRQYRDTYGQRQGKLESTTMEIDDEADIEFTTGLFAGPGLTYTIRIHCHPFKGIEMDLDGPECFFGDPYDDESIIGNCTVRFVGGKPPHNLFLDQASNNVKQIDEPKEENKGNNKKIMDEPKEQNKGNNKKIVDEPKEEKKGSNKQINEAKEEKKSNNINEWPLCASSSSKQAVLNSGCTSGSFNGANFSGFKFDFGQLMGPVQGV